MRDFLDKTDIKLSFLVFPLLWVFNACLSFLPMVIKEHSIDKKSKDINYYYYYNTEQTRKN